LFFHGIDFKYLIFQYPILSPKNTVGRKNKKQLEDREHLIERFGFEPVHFLKNNYDYPSSRCIYSCFNFGSVVIGFKELPMPILQLSKHEYGVTAIDVRTAELLFIRDRGLKNELRKLFSKIPIVIMK